MYVFLYNIIKWPYQPKHSPSYFVGGHWHCEAAGDGDETGRDVRGGSSGEGVDGGQPRSTHGGKLSSFRTSFARVPFTHPFYTWR